MKFRVDVVQTNQTTFEQKFIVKDFDDDYDAHIERDSVIDGTPRGWAVTYSRVYPVVKCSCGEEVCCTRFTNTCECGRDYNFAGDLLADRSQWGCETGEHWTECY